MPPRFLLSSSALALSSLAISALLGCRTPSSRVPIDRIEQTQTDPAKGEASERLEPLPVEEPADLLPAELPILAEASDLPEFLELFAPLDKYPEFNDVRARIREELGADLFEPTGWAEIGLDVSGPVGVGMLELRAEAFVVYATLSDPVAFEGAVERFGDLVGLGDRIAVTDLDGARVIRLGKELSVVLREGVAVAVFADDPEDARRDYAVTVATIDPREALGRSEAFAWARAQTRAEDDGMIYAEPARILDEIRDEQRDFPEQINLRYVREDLEQARRNNAPPDVIRDLERRVEEEERWWRERQKAQAGERALADATLGKMASVVVAADLQPGGIVAHGRVLMPEESPLRKVFEPVEAESPLLTALDEEPLFVVDGRAQMSALLELLELLIGAEGHTLHELNQELMVVTGIDLLRDLVPNLTGAAGLAITQDQDPDLGRIRDIPRSFGVAAHVELQDPDALREVLDGLARSQRLGGMLKRSKGGWEIDVPEWRSLRFEIEGQRLLVFTDPGFAKRVRDAERGEQAEALASPEHPLRGPATNPSLRLYQRWRLLALLEAHEPWAQGEDGWLYNLDSHARLTPEQAAKVPKSKAFKKKKREFAKLLDELNELNRREAREELERMLQFADSVGEVGMQVEPTTDGLALHASWRFAKGTSPVDMGFRMFTIRGDDANWRERERIMGEIEAVARELRSTRTATLDRWATKHGF